MTHGDFTAIPKACHRQVVPQISNAFKECIINSQSNHSHHHFVMKSTVDALYQTARHNKNIVSM